MNEILKTVSLNLDLCNYEHVMCSSCSINVYSAFDFKSTCLYIEDKIISYLNPELPFIDLREVYLKEYENKPSVKMEDDQKICRLCLQLVREGFVTFYEVKLETMHRYIPEVNFGVTQDPVICKECFNSLSFHVAFIQTCLDIEMKIPIILDDRITDFRRIKSENDEIVLRDEKRMKGLVKIEKEVEAEETLIKIEEVNIKSEGNHWKGDSQSFDLHNEIIENKMGECENKDPLEIKMYKCDVCSFEAKYRSHLKVHQLSHMDRAEIKMYKCDACEYETKYKGHLKSHQLLHLSDIQTYKCDTCSYETKFKRNLKTHQLMHKDSSEIHMYKCDACAFETKHKGNLKMHQLLHKDPSKIKMYKCDTCGYENKYRSHLKSHQKLTHKNTSEIQMYKCDTCTYETKYKYDIKRHQLVHQNPSAIQLYKCDTCPYETKYKGNLKDHQLTHENLSTAQQECVLETIHKQGLKIHVVKHQNLLRGQMYKLYKCDTCVFQTKHKRSLVRHQSMHKTTKLK
ncbi:zinc finger protein 227-like [Anoplophora glabripennis]|uniref:zinc finger protein 227-like n=1 Tax=Anoplophora glabripennis TaxID=217634 RepID=UPI0008749BCF|nr:zinc finger protein 227-like [Anoplophora glabripennis]